MDVDKHKIWLIAIAVIALLAFGFLLIYPSLSDAEFVGQAVFVGDEVPENFVCPTVTAPFGTYDSGIAASYTMGNQNFLSDSHFDFTNSNACFQRIAAMAPVTTASIAFQYRNKEHSCEEIYKGVPIVKVSGAAAGEDLYQIMYWGNVNNRVLHGLPDSFCNGAESSYFNDRYMPEGYNEDYNGFKSMDAIRSCITEASQNINLGSLVGQDVSFSFEDGLECKPLELPYLFYFKEGMESQTQDFNYDGHSYRFDVGTYTGGNYHMTGINVYEVTPAGWAPRAMNKMLTSSSTSFSFDDNMLGGGPDLYFQVGKFVDKAKPASEWKVQVIVSEDEGAIDVPVAEVSCTDGFDNDHDGDVDCSDFDCQGDSSCAAPVDSDGDGVVDGEDNCPTVSNANQADFDSDAIGDVCDPDTDGDGILNDGEEVNCEYDPSPSCGVPMDSDSDGVVDSLDLCPNSWGVKENGCNPLCNDVQQPKVKVNQNTLCLQKIQEAGLELSGPVGNDFCVKVFYGVPIIQLYDGSESYSFVKANPANPSETSRHSLFECKGSVANAEQCIYDMIVSGEISNYPTYEPSCNTVADADGDGISDNDDECPTDATNTCNDIGATELTFSCPTACGEAASHLRDDCCLVVPGCSWSGGVCSGQATACADYTTGPWGGVATSAAGVVIEVRELACEVDACDYDASKKKCNAKEGAGVGTTVAVEICDNGIDDDENTFPDCLDTACQHPKIRDSCFALGNWFRETGLNTNLFDIVTIDPKLDSDGDGVVDLDDACPSDATNTCNDPVELGGVCTSDAHCVGDLECAGGVCALYTCEDSDGTVSGIDSGDGMTFVEKTDGCVGVAGGTPTNVIDWSCDAAGYVSSEITSCSDGEICTGAGVCVSEDIDGDGVLDSVDMCPNLQTSVKQHTAGSSLGCIFGDSDNTGCLKSQEFLSMKYYYLNTDEAATVSCSATNAPADCLQSNEFLALKYYYLNTDDPSTVACS